MQGEIHVGRLMDFYHRQKRMLEWIALKEYWRAKENGEEDEVFRLYGKVLTRALHKRYSRQSNA